MLTITYSVADPETSERGGHIFSTSDSSDVLMLSKARILLIFRERIGSRSL